MNEMNYVQKEALDVSRCQMVEAEVKDESSRMSMKVG